MKTFALILWAGLLCDATATVTRAQSTGSGTQPVTPSSTPPAQTRPARPPNAATQPQFQDKRDRAAEVVGRIVAETHGSAAWAKQTAVQADIAVHVGQAMASEGTLLVETASRKARMQLKDGTTIVFDGEKTWVSPANAKVPGIEGSRFHVQTLPMILAAPFRLPDPAMALTAYNTRPLQDQAFDTFTASFKNGRELSGEWWMVYADQPSHLLHALGNITAFGKPPADLNTQPHAVTFDAATMKTVDGMVLATNWTFWNWNKDLLIEGEPIGKAAISNIAFVKPPEDAFAKPSDAREEP